MSKCKDCLKILSCKYNDGHNPYCKDDYKCPHFLDKEIIEKQIPKKPTPHKVDVEKIKIGNVNWCKGTTIYYCPNCKDFISRVYTYCHKCGQALDWGDTE